MPKILIKKILHKEKLSKENKPYTTCSILTVDKNGVDTWINSFGNDATKDFRVGQTVDLDIYQEEYNGKTYLKFREVIQRSMFAELDKINAKLDVLMGKKPVSAAEDLGLTAEPPEEQPVEFHKPDEVQVADIPF